ncbi:MAG: PilZ domain-containing protein [bacterium]|nr:PilZ domain-containing protein [bacterium]
MNDSRKHKRIKVDNLSRLNSSGCSIINVSKDGLLVSTDHDADAKTVDIQLKVNHQWVDLKAEVMWSITDGDHISMGLFIIEAPDQYHDFIADLYLEANEK